MSPVSDEEVLRSLKKTFSTAIPTGSNWATPPALNGDSLSRRTSAEFVTVDQK